MNLILWRHADAEDGVPDERRALTHKGHRQAARMAGWLRERLPDATTVLVSPAVRAQQTAAALAEADPRLRSRLATEPGVGTAATPEGVLAAAGWPGGQETVVVVGHQPTLGAVAARLLAGVRLEWSVRKGAIIWIEHRDRAGHDVLLRAALSPDLL